MLEAAANNRTVPIQAADPQARLRIHIHLNERVGVLRLEQVPQTEVVDRALRWKSSGGCVTWLTESGSKGGVQCAGPSSLGRCDGYHQMVDFRLRIGAL